MLLTTTNPVPFGQSTTQIRARVTEVDLETGTITIRYFDAVADAAGLRAKVVSGPLPAQLRSDIEAFMSAAIQTAEPGAGPIAVATP